jgi:hypothetical protein
MLFRQPPITLWLECVAPHNLHLGGSGGRHDASRPRLEIIDATILASATLSSGEG